MVRKAPSLAIIIDEKTNLLDEVCGQIPSGQAPNRFQSIEVVEFRTFEREGCGPLAHAHVFEPLGKPSRETELIKPTLGPQRPANPSGPGRILSIQLSSPSCIKFHLFMIPKGQRGFFPGYKIPFKLDTDKGVVETYVSSARGGTVVGDPNSGKYVQADLAKWYSAHPELRVGSRLEIEAIEPTKSYCLRIVQV